MCMWLNFHWRQCTGQSPRPEAQTLHCREKPATQGVGLWDIQGNVFSHIGLQSKFIQISERQKALDNIQITWRKPSTLPFLFLTFAPILFTSFTCFPWLLFLPTILKSSESGAGRERGWSDQQGNPDHLDFPGGWHGSDPVAWQPKDQRGHNSREGRKKNHRLKEVEAPKMNISTPRLYSPCLAVGVISSCRENRGPHLPQFYNSSNGISPQPLLQLLGLKPMEPNLTDTY